jgi:hypothetical protein
LRQKAETLSKKAERLNQKVETLSKKAETLNQKVAIADTVRLKQPVNAKSGNLAALGLRLGTGALTRLGTFSATLAVPAGQSAR